MIRSSTGVCGESVSSIEISVTNVPALFLRLLAIHAPGLLFLEQAGLKLSFGITGETVADAYGVFFELN